MVKAAEQGRVTNREATQGLGLSARQFQRLRKKVREGDETSVRHGNRGRPSPRRLSAESRGRIVALLQGAVKLNGHHIADLLREEPRRKRNPSDAARLGERAVPVRVVVHVTPTDAGFPHERLEALGVAEGATACGSGP